MRDLTKSSLSFSWSMSLFGLQQLGSLLTPGGATSPGSRATEVFERVTDAMAKQLGDALGETFRAGDKLQRGVVDLAFRALRIRTTNPPAPAQRVVGCRSCARPGWQTDGARIPPPYQPMHSGGQP